MPETLLLRPANPADLALLRRWDEQPHIVACDPNDDWDWEVSLHEHPDWREQLIAELDGRPIDIWIGAAGDLGRGHGTRMMRLALERCFADGRVTAVLIDPLAANTAAHRFYRRFGFRPVERRRFGRDDCLVHRLERAQWAKAMERF